MYAWEPGDEATFPLNTPYLVPHVPVQPQEVESNVVYCTQHTYMSPHDMYQFTVVSCQLSVVTFSFSHVHSSLHISNDSFITTFTSEGEGSDK